MNCPAGPGPRTSTLGGRKTGRRMQKAVVGGREPKRNRGGEGHCLGKVALATDLGQTLARNDGRSNELCLSAPSQTGSNVSFTNSLPVTLGLTGRTKPHLDKALHSTHPRSKKSKRALVKSPLLPQLWWLTMGARQSLLASQQDRKYWQRYPGMQFSSVDLNFHEPCVNIYACLPSPFALQLGQFTSIIFLSSLLIFHRPHYPSTSMK